MAKIDRVPIRLELDESGHWCASGASPEVSWCITDGKTLRTVRKRVREVLAMEWGEKRAERAILEESVVVTEHADEVLREALEARAEAEQQRERAQDLMRQAVKLLSKRKVGTRDAGELLGLSQARVAQLLREQA